MMLFDEYTEYLPCAKPRCRAGLSAAEETLVLELWAKWVKDVCDLPRVVDRLIRKRWRSARRVRLSAARTIWKHWKTATDEVFQQTMIGRSDAKRTSTEWIRSITYATFAFIFFLPFVYAPSSRPLQSHFAFFELSSAFVDHLVEMSVVYTMLPIIVLYYILTHVVLHACISYSWLRSVRRYTLFVYTYIRYVRRMLIHFIIRSLVLWTVDLMFCACFFLIFFPNSLFPTSANRNFRNFSTWRGFTRKRSAAMPIS